MRYTQGGSAVCTLNVATNRSYKNSSGEQVKETVYFRVSVWGKSAENQNQYLSKGSQIMVEGRITGNEFGGPKIWTNSDGEPRSAFEINARDVVWLKINRDEEVAQPAPEEDFPF
jgi:single-strand DNA-binding protein